jgi:hypothetical protein
VLKIAGVKHWLWRAVDQTGIVLDVLLSIVRLSGNAAAALVFVEVFEAVFERGFFEIGIPCSSSRFSYRPDHMAAQPCWATIRDTVAG